MNSGRCRHERHHRILNRDLVPVILCSRVPLPSPFHLGKWGVRLSKFSSWLLVIPVQLVRGRVYIIDCRGLRRSLGNHNTCAPRYEFKLTLQDVRTVVEGGGFVGASRMRPRSSRLGFLLSCQHFRFVSGHTRFISISEQSLTAQLRCTGQGMHPCSSCDSTFALAKLAAASQEAHSCIARDPVDNHVYRLYARKQQLH